MAERFFLGQLIKDVFTHPKQVGLAALAVIAIYGYNIEKNNQPADIIAASRIAARSGTVIGDCPRITSRHSDLQTHIQCQEKFGELLTDYKIQVVSQKDGQYEITAQALGKTIRTLFILDTTPPDKANVTGDVEAGKLPITVHDATSGIRHIRINQAVVSDIGEQAHLPVKPKIGINKIKIEIIDMASNKLPQEISYVYNPSTPQIDSIERIDDGNIIVGGHFDDLSNFTPQGLNIQASRQPHLPIIDDMSCNQQESAQGFFQFTCSNAGNGQTKVLLKVTDIYGNEFSTEILEEGYPPIGKITALAYFIGSGLIFSSILGAGVLAVSELVKKRKPRSQQTDPASRNRVHQPLCLIK